MKGKVSLFVLSAIIIAQTCTGASPATPFFEGSAGLLASNGSQAPVYGVRGGARIGNWDASLGYWRAIDVRSGSLVSGDLDLHTISLEVYRSFSISEKLEWNLGGGIGYTIPNLSNGMSETADNDLSWVAGGGISYDINSALALETSLKAFFFRTDTHVTSYGAHTETLSDGITDVAVLDTLHNDDSVRFNSALLTVALKFK